ncbi:MAG: response regulator [Deltaproteobacteria bacterium]|nr:response regulator [Deltaproteobacteria bacterium]
MDTKSYILLVNRERNFLDTVGQSLTDAGYALLTATTMSEAIGLVGANPVVLIVSDSELADVSGYDFLSAVKSSPDWKDIPFVFFVSIHSAESAGGTPDAGAADHPVRTIEDEVAMVLKAFDMGAHDFIVDTPEEEASKVLTERIGRRFPAMTKEKRGSAAADGRREASAGPKDGDAPIVEEHRRYHERTILKEAIPVELSRDAIFWMPGQIINAHIKGLMMETSLLGKLDMPLYVRVGLPEGKLVLEGHVKHISISNHQMSARIGVIIKNSPEWNETYHYILKQSEAPEKLPAKKRTVTDESPIGKLIDAKMVMQMDAPEIENTEAEDSGSDRALEIKFYRSLVGKKLGNYKAVSFIGAGSMAGVFKGWDVVLERDVALKIISFNLSMISSYRDMFVKEAQLVSRLNHPNIAQIYHIDHADDVLFFAMELISGGTLADIIKDRNNLNTAKGLEHFITICRTLDFVSEQNIVHRDIKPENIMIDDHGVLKVVDFGVAVVNDETEKKKKTEGMVGSPLYASPECSTGRPLDRRSDIYSLGATFYHLFAGVPPFDGDTVDAILSKHATESLVPLKKMNPILSSALSNIIGKMMEKNPDKRYQNYRAIIDDLKVLMK